MAGDLVNRGNDRNEWDELFFEARDVYDRRPVVPVPGNHEYHGGEPELYLRMFTLPEHGPAEIRPEKAYTLRYSNALFVMLDSNLPPESQAAWLDEQLANSDATWKFVVYHHPAYSSSPTRDNPGVRTVWGEIFDRHHVDMALQGHDHAYLRTKPMKGGQPVGSTAEGTVYVVSVSGIKFYEQGEFDYTEFAMTNTPTYQVLDIQVQGDRLLYRAYDLDGNLRDELEFKK
jgi:acid phosphatase type 7